MKLLLSKLALMTAALMAPTLTILSLTPPSAHAGPIAQQAGSANRGRFDDVITAIPGLTHYYPLDARHGIRDAWGGSGAHPASHRNYLNLKNAGGVKFTTTGATFDGSPKAFLTARSSPDFSVTGTNSIAFLVVVTFPTYAQTSSFHWMSKGGSTRTNFEWALRLYGDGNGERDRGVSNYYWNPNPKKDVRGKTVPGARGSGAYLMPPEGQGTRHPNGPVGSGSPNKEHIFGFEFTYAGRHGYAGRCRFFYGSSTVPMKMISDRAMNDDAPVTPKYTLGDLFIGKRGDNDGMVKAKIRRVAFFNRTLSPASWQNIGAAMPRSEG